MIHLLWFRCQLQDELCASLHFPDCLDRSELKKKKKKPRLTSLDVNIYKGDKPNEMHPSNVSCNWTLEKSTLDQRT